MNWKVVILGSIIGVLIAGALIDQINRWTNPDSTEEIIEPANGLFQIDPGRDNTFIITLKPMAGFTTLENAIFNLEETRGVKVAQVVPTLYDQGERRYIRLVKVWVKVEKK